MAGEPVQRRLQFVLQQYGKRPTQNITLNYFGLANEVFIITTADGKFVVKNCFKNSTPELLRNELALAERLNEQGVPAPKPVSTADGRPFVDFDGQLYVMHEFVNGTVPNWENKITRTHNEEMIRALADFHRATEEFELPYESGRIGALDTDGIERWLESLESQLAAADPDRQSVMRLKALMPNLHQRLRELTGQLKDVDTSVMTKAIVHNDFHYFNMIFNDEQSRYNAIVDFDFIREDYRLADLIWTITATVWSYWFPELFGFRPSSDNRPADDQIIAAHKASIVFAIEEYRKHNLLSDEELAFFPVFYRAMVFYCIRFFKLSNSEEECLGHVEWFEWLFKVTPLVEQSIAQAFAELNLK